MNDFEKRWQRISELLQIEISGDERPMVSSGRTLFGIKSDAEEKMDQFAKEIEEEYAAKRKARAAARRTEREGQVPPSSDETHPDSENAAEEQPTQLTDTPHEEHDSQTR